MSEQTDNTGQNGVDRRRFLRTAGLGALTVGAVSALNLGGSAEAALLPTSTSALTNAGYGMHSTKSTATMVAVATINPMGVTCGVTTGPGTDISLGGFTGPFVMEMYALTVDRYDIDHVAGVIKATGNMRSVTKVAGVTLEDVVHPYLGVGIDGRGAGPDKFVINFLTPFWNPTNPMATPSEYVGGWVEFGGALLIGEVNVTLV